MRSHPFVLTVRQSFHLWGSRGKISWHFAAVQVHFFPPKPLQIFGFENYSTDKFYPGEPSKNLHCEQMYAKIHRYCFCYCLLFSKETFCTLSWNWIGSMMLWPRLPDWGVFNENGFFINFYACAVCSSYCIFYILSEVVLSYRSLWRQF